MSIRIQLTTVLGHTDYEKTFDQSRVCVESWGRQIRVYDYIEHELVYEVPIDATIVEYICKEDENGN